jgi:ribonuclease Z
MPTDRFVEAAKDVTLMIHEATMGDEELEQAFHKKHSTFSQALDIGRRYSFI